MTIRSSRRIAGVVLVAAGCVRASASWIQFDLPALSWAWGATALGHLPDGRWVFAENGNFYRQDAWGVGTWSAYGGEPATDPSFIAVWSDTLAVSGRGGWGASDLDRFDPSDLSDPNFTAVGVSLQNYHGVFRDATSLYVGGADTGPGGNLHGIRYVTLDGTVNKVIVDGISTYSCGFGLDPYGFLYVGDNDDGRVYRFSPAQLDAAIAGSPLSIGDGEFVHDFGEGGNLGTLAVDPFGRVWAAGWWENGLKMYNPLLGQEFHYIPHLTNAHYKVTTFSRQGEWYVAYMNQADPSQNNSPQYYGYAGVAAFPVPEPETYALLLAGLVGGIALVRRGVGR